MAFLATLATVGGGAAVFVTSPVLATARTAHAARRPEHVVRAPSLGSDLSLAQTRPQPVSLVLRPTGGSGIAVFSSIGALAPSQVFAPHDELGSPLVLLAVARYGDWFQALLPTRPNGSTAWVRSADVVASAPENHVEVSLAAHELRVVRNTDGQVLLTSPAGVGSPQTPTPTGTFFVRDHFPTGSTSHPYGPFAFGLSGHSDVYQHFGTGDGRIAIHGTNQPATIGGNASNGCVHVPNDVVLELVPLLPLGTPVIIS